MSELDGSVIGRYLRDVSWEGLMEHAVRKMLEDFSTIEEKHTVGTPARVVKAFKDYFSGVHHSPLEALNTTFDSACDEMIIVKDIRFTSFCAHHLAPFSGVVHFGYIPSGKIVGLSKIPRLIEILSRRPQVQEVLTSQIVDTFQDYIKPKGCAVAIEATHLCMAIRGVRKEGALTRTVGLRGVFKADPSTKQEFLNSIGGR